MTAQRRTLALLSMLLLAVPAASRADEFADFRIPENRVLLWNGSAYGSARWQGSSGADGRDEDGSEYGTLSSRLFMRRESDARVRDFSATVSAGGNRFHRVVRYTPALLGVDAVEFTNRSADAVVSVRDLEQWYPGTLPVSIVAEVSGSYSDRRASDASREAVTYLSGDYFEISSATERWDQLSALSGSVGVGVGRVRNATGLFEALVFEQRLLASGALARPLGAAARRELATLFYARSDYSQTMDRPAATVWGAIEDILRRDGSLSGRSLDARDLFAAAEPYMRVAGYTGPDALPNSPIVRLQGWSLRAVAVGRTEHYVRRTSSSGSSVYIPGLPASGYHSYTRLTLPVDAAGAGVAGELHRAAGLRWQFDATFNAEVPVTTKKRGFAERLGGAARFIVTDRWLASLRVDHQRLLDRDWNGYTRADHWILSSDASCEYWLTDRVAASLGFSQAWSRLQGDDFSFAPGVRRGQSGSLTLGLGYRFAGFAEIPGLPAPGR